MVVIVYTTSYAISAHHYWCCEFESWSGRGVQHYVIKFVSDLQQVSGFLHQKNWPPPNKEHTHELFLVFCNPTDSSNSPYLFFFFIKNSPKNIYIFFLIINKESFFSLIFQKLPVRLHLHQSSIYLRVADKQNSIITFTTL